MMQRSLVSLAIVLGLAACGSSGGSSSPSPSPEPPTEPPIEEGTLVSTPSGLQQAIGNAEPGDVILLANGTWHDLELAIPVSGRDGAPIVIGAQTPGQVHLTGNSLWELEGDHLEVRNLVWQDVIPQDSRGMVILRGSHNHFTQNTLFGDAIAGNSNCDDQDTKWVSLQGQYHEVSHNRFEGKCGKGVLLTVWRQHDVQDHHHIHHNLFKDYVAKGSDSNGYETLRIGTSTYSQSDSSTLVEHNLFLGMNGEIEIISSKSGNNVFRGNTFRDSDGLLTLRHGKNATVEDNVFLQGGSDNGGGIRAFDSGHVIRNNYIQGVDTGSSSRGGIVLHAGINEHGSEPSSDPDDNLLSKQWTANTILVEDNTLYNSDQGIYQNAYLGTSSCKDGSNKVVECQRGWDVSFSSNLVYHPNGQAVTLAEDTAIINASYNNEHYWGDDGAGLTGPGIHTGQPELYTDPNTGLVWSPAGGANLNRLHPLTEADVGPSYQALPH